MAAIPRGLQAAFLLAMIVVSSADRALKSTKLGGSSRALLVQNTDNNPQTNNYFVTNGNGSWTTTPYSTGVTGAFPAINTVWSEAQEYDNGMSGSNSQSLPDMANFLKYGINSVTFTSKNMGFAVMPVEPPNSGPTTNTMPKIIMTNDGAATWMWATGVPIIGDSDSDTGDLSASPPTLIYPAIQGGDLTCVYFASSTLGWAVGANAITFHSGYYSTATLSATPDKTPAGYIFQTTNGGTVWTQVPTMYTRAQASAVIAAGNLPAIKAFYAQYVPGALMAITSDSAGKTVVAVGSPGSSLQYAVSTTDYQMQVVPTIMYSGNSGASWAFQTAPALGGMPYALYSVAVQTSTKFFAVGGSVAGMAGNNNGCPTNWAGPLGCAGQILGTTNGGFSWSMLVFPGAGGASAPLFSSVAVNGGMVWVGGATRQDAYFPLANTATTAGAACPVLLSMDGVKFVAASTYATFPAGFIQTGSSPSSSTITTQFVLGIVWESSVRGYIYGGNFIMTTNNGGRLWAYETPNAIVTAGNMELMIVRNVAVIPTSY